MWSNRIFYFPFYSLENLSIVREHYKSERKTLPFFSSKRFNEYSYSLRENSLINAFEGNENDDQQDA